MLTRRDLVMLLAGAVLGTIAVAMSAPEVQLEFGQCRFGAERDGTFYQKDSAFRNYLSPRCGSLGLASKFRDSRLGWRIAYITTGAIEARDNYAVLNDHGERGAPCNPDGGVYTGCHATFIGSGRMQGVSLSLTGDYKAGPLTLIAETGLLFFKSYFNAMLIPADYQCCRGYVSEESSWFDTPIPLLGLTARVGSVYVAARHYWPAEHRALSLTDHSFTQLSVGLAFPLP